MGITLYIYKTLSKFIPIPEERKKSPDIKGGIWFHAASLGETLSVMPLIEKFTRNKTPLFLTTMTRSGKKRAEVFNSQIPAFLFPWDNPSVIDYWIKSLYPKSLILTESEIWPNLISEFQKRKIPVILVNGRMSRKSFLFYSNFGKDFYSIFKRFDYAFVQNRESYIRYKKLGVPDKRIKITGNLKYDALKVNVKPLIPSEEIKGRFVVTFGSIRRKEIDTLSKFLSSLLEKHPDILFIIAPRHLINVGFLIQRLRKHKIPYSLRSEENPSRPVWVLDTLGELVNVWKFTDVAIVGGTFFNYGGHNLAEPAAFSCPVIFGPDVRNTKDVAYPLLKTGAGIRINSLSEIPKLIDRLKEERRSTKIRGKKAREVVLSLTGSVEEVFKKIQEIGE